MYLAPLNYDRYFRKVFSGTFNFEMQFDFRCKIDNKFVIIDMQQWYKTDIMKRFYAYHSVTTAIQLENLATDNTHKFEDKLIEINNYSII